MGSDTIIVRYAASIVTSPKRLNIVSDPIYPEISCLTPFTDPIYRQGQARASLCYALKN